jgi:hypothetical protein
LARLYGILSILKCFLSILTYLSFCSRLSGKKTFHSEKFMPAAPGKTPVTMNMPEALKRRIGVEAEKRGIRKSHLITSVLEAFLDAYLGLVDSRSGN